MYPVISGFSMAGPSSHKIKLFQKLGEGRPDSPLVALAFKEGDTLKDFRLRLTGVCGFDYDFRDYTLPGPVTHPGEGLVLDLEGSVVVV